VATLKVRVFNAKRQPLDDQMDVLLVSARTDATVARALGVRGRATVKFDDLVDGQPYIIKVFPTRHRPVAQFALPIGGEPLAVNLYSPIHPDRVNVATFPSYADVDPALTDVLERSTIEGVADRGAALYAALSDPQKAGLFNLFSKMHSVGFDDDRTIWSFVDSLYRIRADRVFVDVQPALRDLVKSAIVSGRFREVPGALHQPPPEFVAAGSFKTGEQYGNLQLSFFASVAAPLAFKVDADIDDAAGLGHTFQVIRNWATQGTTHPYDIHEILVFRQEATLPYELA
jgi:hypothetical protein